VGLVPPARNSENERGALPVGRDVFTKGGGGSQCDELDPVRLGRARNIPPGQKNSMKTTVFLKQRVCPWRFRWVPKSKNGFGLGLKKNASGPNCMKKGHFH